MLDECRAGELTSLGEAGWDRSCSVDLLLHLFSPEQRTSSSMGLDPDGCGISVSMRVVVLDQELSLHAPWSVYKGV